MSNQYKGSCHCGAVTYSVETDLANPITCNCSICNRTGAVYIFVPENQVTLESGEDNLTDYQFGKKHIHHAFCSTCGVRSYGWGKDEEGNMTYAINARCLKGVDINALQPTMYDGKSL